MSSKTRYYLTWGFLYHAPKTLQNMFFFFIFVAIAIAVFLCAASKIVVFIFIKRFQELPAVLHIFKIIFWLFSFAFPKK